MFVCRPPLDPVFYPSPTPQSPSIHSQDSPSFIYPTPPASLESHNLQSPLFPFPSTTSTNPVNSSTIPTSSCTPPQASSNNNTTLIYPFETQLNNNNNTITLIPNPTVASNLTSANSIIQTQFQQQASSGMIVRSDKMNEAMSNVGGTSTKSHDIVLVYTTAGTGSNVSNVVGQSSFISSVPMLGNRTMIALDSRLKHNSNVKMRSFSGNSISDNNMNTLTPSSSPSIASTASCASSWSTAEDSMQSMKELKLNETNRMDCSVIGVGDGEEIFRNPNRYKLK